MANTYTLISSNTLSASAASVTFSSIPSTYTDLVLKYSARTLDTAIADNITIRFNSDTASNYSLTTAWGDGSSSNSVVLANIGYGRQYYGFDSGGATANTFANGEMYLPNYTVSQNKPISFISGTENNAATGYEVMSALLWRNTAAVSTITITANSGTNIASGSSFYLYGIKNS